METSFEPALYPARLGIDYPEEPLDRLSTGLRLFYVVPIVIVLDALGRFGGTGLFGRETEYFAGAGVLFLPVLLLILFRQKYPRWWFDFNVELTRFANRVVAYFALLADRYPSTNEQQYVHLEIDYPDVPQDLNRWLPLVKWLLAIPHYILLFFLGIGAVVAVIFAWFAILFTGQYPRGLFDYVVGVMRWGLRVEAYVALLVTDRYPPFSLA